MATDDPTEIEPWVRERVLGSGGFGEVTLWRNRTENTMIALKKCRTGTDTLLTKKHKERWSKEVDIMQRLNHPNVVKAVPVPEELSLLRSELPLMCMEYCSKGDLRQVLNRNENCCGLREYEVRSLISDVKSAVHYLHLMKITHRDLKPENIVLQQENNRIVYKLIDLGYAKELDQSSICTSFVGTLQYLAPELFMSKSYNYSVDYWSLGLVSHEVIAGIRPFLPNMTPAAWMKYVREKSSDDICAFQAQDGTIVFSKELFPQNHITSCLKDHMERWLKLILEWDAAKRGRILNKNKEPEIVVFSLIEDILSKKILNIFLVPNYQNLSYEVDDATAISTLQLWIERDTGISVQEQELLLPSGQPFDQTKQACQCWVVPDANNQGSGIMAFVYRRGSLGVEEVAPRIPRTVEKMMEEPRNPIEYIHQKRAWSHAVFFLQQEMELYHKFLQAYRVKMLNVFSNNSKLGKQARTVMNQFQQMEAQYQLFLDSLHFDREQAKRLLLSTEVMAPWNRANKLLSDQVGKLKEAILQLESKYDAVNSKTAKLQRGPATRMQDHDILSSLFDAGLKCYDSLRKRPKETRQQRMDNVDMVKVVYNCLKHRDKLLRDEEFNNHLKQLVSVQSEIEQLWSPLNMSLQVITKLQGDLRQMQLDRQKDIWRQLGAEPCNGYTVPSIPANKTTKPQVPPHGMPVRTISEQESSSTSLPVEHTPADVNRNRRSSTPLTAGFNSLSVTNTPSREQTPGPDLSVSLGAQPDTSAMINDNIALRYMTQDMMNWSYQQYRRFMSEDQSLDWTFLEKDS